VSFVGVNLTDPAYSAVFPGTYDTDWRYPSANTFSFLAGRGVRQVRLGFRWDRMQPTLGAALDATELGRLTDCLTRAATAGIGVIIVPHNGGGYTSGGVERQIGAAGGPTQAQFADLWARLSTALKANAAVIGYGLVHAPHDFPGTTGSFTPVVTRYDWEPSAGGFGAAAFGVSPFGV
jgi:endoglucanase